MNIITGYRGEAHITADQIRDQNQGCFGDGSYILDVGSKLEATAISATSVQLADGIISHQGCTASIPYGTTEAVTIGNGTQGMQRIDLIVARYTKDAGTDVEDMELAVIQGTPAASNPSTPSYNQGSIHAGDSPVDMPLFEVALDGISIDSVTQVASVVKTQAETDAEISALNSSFVETHASFGNAKFYNSAVAVVTKIGKVVILTVPALTGLTANAQTDLGEIIPAGFRPSGLVYADCVDGNSSFRVVRISVNESGKMLIYNYSSTTGLINISGRIVYFTS